jgi:hypothetical protein
MSNSKLLKVKSIINSCETYEQIQSCFSFINGNFFTEISDKIKILSFIQEKTYSLRNADLAFHRSEMKKIHESFKKFN